MNKKIILKLALGILFVVAFLQFYTREQTQLRLEDRQSTITQDDRFQGKKLGENYYEFSLIDYHRLLIQDRPFILYFFANWCEDCERQHRMIEETVNAGRLDKVFLRVNFADTNTDETEKTIGEAYKIKEPNMFIGLDKDSNPVIRETAKRSIEQLINLMERI